MAASPLTRHLVSYPKSGRTWVRYMLKCLGHAESISFHHDGFEFNDGARPPHDFDLVDRLKKYRTIDRLAYLERDPRDTIVSLYHQVTGRFQDFFNYQAPISEFIRDGYFGAQNLQKFRLIWREIASDCRAEIFTYEDLHRDPALQLRRLVDHYELNVDDEEIRTAAQASDFLQMKLVEEAGELSEPWLRPRNGFRKLRRGTVGSHRDELSEDDIAYLDRIFSGTA